MIKLKWEIIWTGGLSHLSGLPHLPWVPHLYVNRPLVGCVVYWLECQAAVNRPCFCYRWTRGWSWRPCLWYNTLLRYYVNYVVLMLLYFLSIISMRKGKRLLSKQGQPQPHVHSKARILSTIVKWSIPPVSNMQTSRQPPTQAFSGESYFLVPLPWKLPRGRLSCRYFQKTGE